MLVSGCICSICTFEDAAAAAVAAAATQSVRKFECKNFQDSVEKRAAGNGQRATGNQRQQHMAVVWMWLMELTVASQMETVFIWPGLSSRSKMAKTTGPTTAGTSSDFQAGFNKVFLQTNYSEGTTFNFILGLQANWKI
uniref:Uncharacterized protein n=1 Tax=Glossina brevipalpis TaxID=37001 RepID=A0A1A9W2Q5_9MUSC